MQHPTPDRFVAVVPVKPVATAKSRLSSLGEPLRRALVPAMLADTVAALRGCAVVDSVVVVTDDLALAGVAEGEGAWALPDGVSGDLNGTLRLASAEAVRRVGPRRTLAVCADLPCLRADDLDLLLARAPAGAAYVADAAGTGTTAYLAGREGVVAPAFGGDSARTHREAGAVALDAPTGCRHDVDTPADLETAVGIGLGPRTLSVVGALAPLLLHTTGRVRPPDSAGS